MNHPPFQISRLTLGAAHPINFAHANHDPTCSEDVPFQSSKVNRPFQTIMNSRSISTSCAACAGFLASGSFALAQNEPGHFYMRFDTGPAFVQDADVEQFLGPSPGLEVEFDTGWHLGASGGYQFTDWLAAEVQTGFSVAYIDGFNAGGIREHDSSYGNFPILANVVFQYPCPAGFVPFVGGGAGTSISTLAADDIVVGGSVIDGSEADAVFAYQVFAGLRYELNETMDLGLTYKYFVADGAEWDVEVFPGPDSSIEFDDVETHIAAFTFRMRF